MPNNRKTKSKGNQVIKCDFCGLPITGKSYPVVDENFNKQYLTEQQYSRLFTTASAWAIVIACLGLFGLATYTVE